MWETIRDSQRGWKAGKVRLALVQVLRREKYAAEGTSSARDALEKLNEKSYDLLITDIRMEGMDGMELMRAVKAQYWSVNGTNTIRSGLPVNIQMPPRQSGCVAQSCNERPDLRPGGNNNLVLDHWTPERYFDPSNFVVQPVGFFGNVGRNTLIRPGVFNLNLSLTKDNRLGEGKNLEFRAELFNFLNHPNFGAPNNTVFRDAAGNLDPNVGRITTTSTKMRQIQLGLKFIF